MVVILTPIVLMVVGIPGYIYLPRKSKSTKRHFPPQTVGSGILATHGSGSYTDLELWNSLVAGTFWGEVLVNHLSLLNKNHSIAYFGGIKLDAKMFGHL